MLLVIYCIVIFWGKCSGWNLNSYRGREGEGRWRELEKDVICVYDDECYFGDFIRGFFYIFSEVDFFFYVF